MSTSCVRHEQIMCTLSRADLFCISLCLGVISVASGATCSRLPSMHAMLAFSHDHMARNVCWSRGPPRQTTPPLPPHTARAASVPERLLAHRTNPPQSRASLPPTTYSFSQSNTTYSFSQSKRAAFNNERVNNAQSRVANSVPCRPTQAALAAMASSPPPSPSPR